MIEQVVSGGQTGADRAGLDAAMALGIPVGGWCPRGRRAEDGPIPAIYPLTETSLSSCLWRIDRRPGQGGWVTGTPRPPRFSRALFTLTEHPVKEHGSLAVRPHPRHEGGGLFENGGFARA